MNISQQAIILSAELSTLTHKENEARTRTLKNCLTDINVTFNEAVGVYNGREEKSFVVLPRNEVDVEVVKDFAFKTFNQEAVLLQDSNQEAHLVFANGSSESIGVLQEVDETLAKDKGNFTILNGKYYTTIPRGV